MAKPKPKIRKRLGRNLTWGILLLSALGLLVSSTNILAAGSTSIIGVQCPSTVDPTFTFTYRNLEPAPYKFFQYYHCKDASGNSIGLLNYVYYQIVDGGTTHTKVSQLSDASQLGVGGECNVLIARMPSLDAIYPIQSPLDADTSSCVLGGAASTIESTLAPTTTEATTTTIPPIPTTTPTTTPSTTSTSMPIPETPTPLKETIYMISLVGLVGSGGLLTFFNKNWKFRF